MVATANANVPDPAGLAPGSDYNSLYISDYHGAFPMKTVSTLTLRKKLGQVLDEVAAGEPVTVTRANRALAVLVPAAEYAAGTASRRRRLETAAARVAEWRAAYAAKRGRVDPVALVRKDRESR